MLIVLQAILCGGGGHQEQDYCSSYVHPEVFVEAKKTCRILEENGFTVASRVCGVKKSKAQTPAELMSELQDQGPELIVNAGLCTACETKILQYDKVPVTTFIVRDKKLNNYPASAVYASDKWRDWAKEIYRDKNQSSFIPRREGR